MCIAEKNISNWEVLTVGPLDFLRSFKDTYLVFYSKAHGCFDFLK